MDTLPPTTRRKFSCRKCDCQFSSLLEQREHFKSDAHAARLASLADADDAVPPLPAAGGPPLLTRVSSHESEFSESIEHVARVQWANSPVASVVASLAGAADEGVLHSRLLHVHKALLPDDWSNYADVVTRQGHQCIEMPLDVLTGGAEALWAVILFR